MCKQQSFTLFFLSAFLFITVVSCKKGNHTQTTPPQKSKTSLLSQASWKLIKAEEKSSSATIWNDVTTVITPCKRDDIYFFRADGTWDLNEGPTKCSPSDPQVFLTGTWTFFNNETQIKRYEGVGTSLLVTFNVEQLDETTLIITTTSGLIYTRNTYGH
jgi:hypothetical protein